MKSIETCYGSYLVDSHISDCGESALSKLDAGDFVEMVRRAGSDSVIVYAACCNGLYYYSSGATHMDVGSKSVDRKMKPMESHYAGYIVDSHVTEHLDTNLSKLTPENFVATTERAGVDSVMAYAACHNGNYYYPSQSNYLHKGLKGRDFFGETVALLRKRGIIPRAYCTMVYQRRIARENPDWRVCQVDGTQSYRRSWHLCPNAPGYREYAAQHVREICAYDIEGIFIDMTFWPGVCFCHNCRSRYLHESGREIPLTVAWDDPAWVSFQRFRERWLAEFAQLLTDACKSVKPNIAVAHQFSPVLLGWMYGQTTQHAHASDVLSGDFYGGRNQHRFGAKVLAAFPRKLPFEFMTSRCVTLYDHTSTKSNDELISSCATTLANGGTYLLIDAINPDGSLEPRFYDRMERIGGILKPFREKLSELRPKLVADVGLYFSLSSNIRRDHNGKTVRDIMNPANNMLAISDLRTLQEGIGTAIALNRAHIPYVCVLDATTDYRGLKTIILNDASVLSVEEVERLRSFVRDGGTLIATGLTSLQRPDGASTGDFALADVLGVHFTGKFSRMWNYLVPVDGGEMVSCDIASPLVKETTATRLASVAEADFDYNDLEHFASYHSNPPGKPGEAAALTVNNFGKGKAIYLYSPILAKQQHAQLEFGAALFKRFAASSIVTACDAPPSVEVTVLRSTQQAKYLLCLVNCQDEAPFIPVQDVSVSVRLPENAWAGACRLVSSGAIIQPVREGETLSFRLPQLDIVEMIEITVQEERA